MQLKKVGKTSSILTVMYKDLFKSNADFINRSKKELAEAQYRLVKTPNYFYKGITYINNSKFPVPILHKSLHKKAIGYLSSTALYIEQCKLFTSYLSIITNSMQADSDLYFLLPKTLHKYLVEITKVDEQPDYIESIRPANYEEIELIVAEQLMFSLLE